MNRITKFTLVFMSSGFALLPAGSAWACGAPIKKFTTSVGLTSSLSSVGKVESLGQGVGANDSQVTIEKYQQELLQLRDAVLKKRQDIAAGKKK